MTDRIPLDRMTSDQLDELYERLEAAEETYSTWWSRAEKGRRRLDAVKDECHALNSETRGLSPVALAARRDAVARIRAVLNLTPPKEHR